MKNIAVQHRTARRSFLTAPVTKAYERMVDAGEVRRDNGQVALAAKLDVLHESLASLPPRRVRTNKPTSSSESRRPLLLSLVRALVSARSFFRKKFDLWYFGSPPRGIYIHGPVGVGKSFLMDLFYASVAGSADNYRCNNRNYKHAKITKRRVHFHEFMLDVHHRIFVYKQQYPRDDALPIIA